MDAMNRNEIEQALVQVRKAYRVLWHYHLRLMDTVRFIAENFSEAEFSMFLCPNNLPGRSSSNPFGRWTWDLTPTQEIRFFYLRNRGIEYNPRTYVQRNDWLLVVNCLADTGRTENLRKHNSNPIDFDAPEKCTTLMEWTFFHNREDRGEVDAWWWNTYSSFRPVRGEIKGYVDKSQLDGVTVLRLQTDVVDLLDENACKERIDGFKSLIKDHCGLDV